MANLLRCANGHQWPEATNSDATTAQIANTCPVCGSRIIAQVHDPAAAVPSEEMTLGGEGPPDRLDHSPTVPAKDSPNSVNSTAPTVPIRNVDDSQTIETDLSVVARRADKPTDVLEVAKLVPPDGTYRDEDLAQADRHGMDNDGDHTEVDEQPAIGDQQTMADPLAQERDKTEATSLVKPTAVPGKQGVATGKRGPLPGTRGKRLRPDAELKLPDKVPGYDIIGELGRGGMGVVYKARQIGLNRICALKMILGGGHASSDAVARFKIEAEAIAHLQHPNIVQVYDTGETNGCPFFSLEFVDGSNLQTKIAGSPQPAAETARLMQQICEGVFAAHQRGILHRDLKPANVLLTKDNVPKITDFGLAKKLEEQDQGQTRTGAILGTPSYMAPEQAMGKAKELGPPADIYSLGAVMYDMLTGRPPFRGVTVMDTLNQVQKLEPLPPMRLAPNVPIDLQTICLKALQKDQKKRYATAGDMADDLRRFQAGEPIKARPTPLWERGAKWVKRRPALATLISVSTMALISVLAMGVLWLNSERVAAQERAEQKTKLADLAEEGRVKAEDAKTKEAALRILAERQRDRAEENFTYARDAVAYMLTRTGLTDLRYEPRFEVVRKDLLEKALSFNLKFLQSRQSSDLSLGADAAKSAREVGYIYQELGNYDKALTHYQQAADQFRGLAKDRPDKEYREGVCACLLDKAAVLNLQGRLQDAEKSYQQALELIEQLAKQFPSDLLYQTQLASIHDDLGTLYVMLNQFPEAEGNYELALRMRTELLARGIKQPEQREQRMRLARTQRNWANLMFTVGKKAEAEKSWLAARDMAQALVKDFPLVPDYVSELVAAYMNLARCYRETNRVPLAATTLRDAIAKLQKLQTDYPNTPVYRQELAQAHFALGELQGLQNQFQEAHDQFAEALKIQTQLFGSQPTVPAIRLQLAKNHVNLGCALRDSDRSDEALDQFRLGVQLLEASKPVAKNSPNEIAEIARAHLNLAGLLVKMGKPLEAEKKLVADFGRVEELVKAFPQSRDYLIPLAKTHRLYAERYVQAGKNAEAAIHCKSGAAAFAQCMVLAEADTTLTPEIRKLQVKDFGNAAMPLLKAAVLLGIIDVDYLKTTPEFQLLRDWPEFAGLVSELQAKADKEASKKK